MILLYDCSNVAATLGMLAEAPPPVQATAPVVLDSDAHQFGIDFSKLSANGKRHAKAMIAGLLRLEAGAV